MTLKPPPFREPAAPALPERRVTPGEFHRCCALAGWRERDVELQLRILRDNPAPVRCGEEWLVVVFRKVCE